MSRGTGVKRTLLRIAIFALVVAGIGAIFLRATRELSFNGDIDLARLEETAIPQLLQRIRNFHRVVTRKGEKLFEISAKEASYFRNDRAIRILEPSIVFFDDGARVGSIQAQQGALVIGGNSIESVDLVGDVKFVLTKFEILAGRIQYLHEEKSIVTTGVTTVVSPELTLKGNDIRFNLRKNTLSVASNVSMTLNQSDADVSARSADDPENAR